VREKGDDADEEGEDEGEVGEKEEEKGEVGQKEEEEAGAPLSSRCERRCGRGGARWFGGPRSCPLSLPSPLPPPRS
jgi:hypothetical protein